MPTPDRDLGRAGLLLVLAVVVAVVAGVGVLFRLGAGPFPDAPSCHAEVGGTEVELSLEQAENASLIAAIGVRRGLPARAVSIALATAFQESKLRNIEYGDRDSLGLFQQRPSQGWGEPAQILDPVYSINAFYDELQKLDGYQDMRITEAAQAVQRSGFPEAYEQHAEGARVLASALTGWSPGAFHCVVDRPEGEAEEIGASGLTPRAEGVRADLDRAFGELSLGGFAPGGVSSGHMEGSAHYEGRALDVFFRPVDEANRRTGWAVAKYLVANAARLEVQHVIFDGRIWSSGRSSEAGWRDYRPRGAADADPGTRAILEHRDHVHVDVVAGG
jgi:hypothetical protein